MRRNITVNFKNNNLSLEILKVEQISHTSKITEINIKNNKRWYTNIYQYRYIIIFVTVILTFIFLVRTFQILSRNGITESTTSINRQEPIQQVGGVTYGPDNDRRPFD